MQTETEQPELDFEQSDNQNEETFEETNEVKSQQAPQTPVYQERKTTIDIDGHQMEVSETLLKKFYGVNDKEPLTEREWKTALSAYKAHKKADINTEKYKRNDKLMYDFVELLQHNPAELLKRAGHDPRKFSEKYITEIIEEELMPEEQRRNLALQRERDELERQLQEERTKQQQIQLDYLTEQHERNISSQIMDALDEQNSLPKTPDVVRRIGYYLMRATQQNLDIPIKRIVALVKNDIYRMNQEISNNLTDEELMSFFGEEKIKKIRQLELQKIKKPQPFSNTVSQNDVPKKTKLDEKKSLTREEFRELIKRRSRI